MNEKIEWEIINWAIAKKIVSIENGTLFYNGKYRHSGSLAEELLPLWMRIIWFQKEKKI